MPATEPAPSTTPETRACLNCGERLLGPYCWSCGQEDVDLHRPLKQLAQDAVGDLLNSFTWPSLCGGSTAGPAGARCSS